MTDERLLIGVVLVLGAWVRLSGLDLGWVLVDQVRDATIALELLGGRHLPVVGPQSRAIDLAGPLYYYLLAIPYGLSANPAVGVAFQSLLSLVSIYLTYRLGTEMFGSPVGLVAAALYAVFPMAVLSGKTLWNPGFLPICTTLFLWTLWRFLTRSRPWSFALVLLLLGIILQIHISGAIFALLLPAALLLYRPSVPRWPLVMGLFSVALLYAPYLLFEVQHGFPDLRKLMAWTMGNLWHEGGQPYWVIAVRGFSTPFSLAGRILTALPQGKSPPAFSLAEEVELILVCLGLLALGVLLARAHDRRPYLLVALWFALPFAIVPHFKAGVFWYYFDVLYPAQFLMIGLLARVHVEMWPESPFGRRIQRWLWPALAALVTALVVIQTWFMMSFENAVNRSGILRLPTDILLSFPDPGWDKNTKLIETIPLRFRNALAEQFQSQLGVSYTILEQRAHGAVYDQFRDDKGLSFLTVSARAPAIPPDPSLHYLLLRGSAEAPLEQGRVVKVGPYNIVIYHPAIRYESWRWSASLIPGWWAEGFDDSAWRPVNLPARKVPDRFVYYESIPLARWTGDKIAFRGWMDVASVERRLWLVVNVRSRLFSPNEVKVFYVNGHAVTTSRTACPSCIITSGGHHIETIADITPALRPGPNLVAFQITGTNEEFDLDIYELRPRDSLSLPRRHP